MSPSVDPAERALEGFAQLPSSQQQDIRTEGRRIGERVTNHVVQILFGPPSKTAAPEAIRHAAGVTLFTGRRTLLATAWHVIKAYLERRESDPPLAFQAGNVLLDVGSRLEWYDPDRDLALIALEAGDLGSIPALTWIASSWPPDQPRLGDYVAFSGFPAHYRRNLAPGQVELNAVGGMMPITSATSNNFKCALPRETLVAIIGSQVPPPGTDLGGMSGGPVFRVGRDVFELTGVVTDFGDNFDMFWMGSLAGVPA